MRFFDGWVMVGIMLIQVNDQRPNEEKQRAWLSEASPCCPTRRGEVFSLPVHKKGLEKFAKELGSAMFSLHIKALRKNLPPPKVAAGPSRSP